MVKRFCEKCQKELPFEFHGSRGVMFRIGPLRVEASFHDHEDSSTRDFCADCAKALIADAEPFEWKS